MVIKTGCRVTAPLLADADEVILATGIKPRTPDIPGIDHPKVLSYLAVLADKRPVGARVAIIGAGGIGFDTAEYLSEPPANETTGDFYREWGIDQSLTQRGGVIAPAPQPSPRQILAASAQARQARCHAGENDRLDPSQQSPVTGS